jgi:Carboxypeptidase regulatory-like domain
MKPFQILSILLLLAFTFVCAVPANADNLYASIRGTVTDPSGAVLPEVALTATNVATGLTYDTKTSAAGTYVFLQLPIGDYTVKAGKSGFKAFTTHGIHLSVNQVYVVDAKMELGAITEEVTVMANAVQVEMSTPQLGSVVNSQQIVDMPLIGRNWVNLQQTQPGVVAASDGRGEFATNGSQSQQNSFLINGTDTNDLALNTRLIIPSPDAIQEFRMVTGAINPEYGRNSGAIVNALIKSGSNSFHGSAFEFYRDSFLNTRNYFLPKPDVFHQNLFGATIGGPIIKNHLFGFFSYQGTRGRQPQAGVAGAVPVFTDDQRNGIFGAADFSGSTSSSPFPMFGDPCPVSGGTPCAAGTPYSTLFASGNIPTQDFATVSNNLLPLIPRATLGGTDFTFNPTTTQKADQYLFRIDGNPTSKDAIWGTWFQNNNPSSSTIPFTGATVPGFGSTQKVHTKFVTASWTHVFNDHVLNEIRGGYTRLNFAAVFPAQVVQPSSVGFDITPQNPGGAGLPVMNVTGLFSLGFSSNGPQPRIDQTYQATDNFSVTKGRHTMKFGFDMRRFRVSSTFNFSNSGTFTFNGAGSFSTGDPGADFLLGLPDGFNQGSGGVLDDFAQQYYSYAQDQYKLRPNLTLTYGLGWTIDTPIVDTSYGNHAMAAFYPGQQSTLFPNAPLGYVFNGDQGVHPSGTTHPFKYWGPRFGFAYSPDWGWITGGPGKTSIRGGYGIYYNRSEEEIQLQFLGMPPFTISSSGAAHPGLGSPYTDVSTGTPVSNPFPFNGVVPRDVQFTAAAGYLPLYNSCCGSVDPKFVDPMAENFNLTLERQLSPNMLMSLGYVGAVAHHLLVGLPVNIPVPYPAAIAPCLADQPNCDAFSQTNPASAGGHPNDFKYPSDIYGPIDQISTIGNSNYNSFQATLNKSFSHGLQFFAAYTYSHSLDNGSGFENTSFGGGGFGGLGSVRAANPYCRSCDYASSIFDARQRFVINYMYRIPGIHSSSLLSRVTNGWTFAGITTFQTGFPLDVVDTSFSSLTCQPNFSDFACLDHPDQVGPVHTFDPRTHLTSTGQHLWFNTDAFAPEPLGAIGNAARNPFRGPGRNNWDFEVFKDTHFTESTYVQLRIEFYNVFNHTQFDPAGISTNINSSRFGQERRAFNPRQIQLAAKFYF